MKHFLMMIALANALICAAMSFSVSDAYAQSANPTTPLVVIRFNQPSVSYERQLYGAIQKAVALKPNLLVDVVSFIPTAQGATQQQLNARAEQNLQRVTQSLAKMGVSGAHVTSLRQYQPGIPSDEVHVFVK